MAKMKTIFDMVVSGNIADYWIANTKDTTDLLGEELFPVEKHLGLKLEYIKGAGGIPVVINQSAFDVSTTYRDRIGVDKVETQMPYFKEAMLIDEELRQQLNILLETGNQKLIDTVLNKIFDDSTTLLMAARMQRERMRMMMLTTGVISITSNGQDFAFDYGVPAENKVTAAMSWSNPKADIVGELNDWLDGMEDRSPTGERPTRAICGRKVMGYIMNNEAIKQNIFVLTQGVGEVTEEQAKRFILDRVGLEIVVYTKKYAVKDPLDPKKKKHLKYVPDDLFVAFPSGTLGRTHMGTTPAESDLMTAANIANVSIVDTGVAITTVKKADPVNIDTIVSMICLPSFEQGDNVLIVDVIAE